MHLNRILAVAALFSACSVFALEPDGREWEDLTRMSQGREKTRASFAPFADEASALAILPWKTDRQICLDSETAWKFNWSKDPASRPVGFQKPDYDVSAWPTIRVPCSWQAFDANGKGGWGTPLYTNARYPFACNPPYVMGEPPKEFTNHDARNPVGSYRRDFDLPADWAGDRVFLKFDGVDSFYYLWVNGEYVGFTKDSRCAAEFDVTKLLKPGRNTVALEVYRYSDGSYLEDQDMFRLSGIFRSAWLVRRPQTRIRDFFAKVRPATAGVYDGDWILDVESELAGDASGATVKAALFDLDGKPVALAPEGTAFRVAKPLTWSPEAPNCYKLVLSLVDGGKTRECVSTLVGFRESKIIDGRYCLNGKKVKLHGANRHETDPRYGHYCPHARQEEDVRLLKRANCNMVRNSHYPQDDYWYYLCNLNGICLMDEANVETHGMGYGEKAASHDPRFRDPIVWRNLNMVERNKNHPAVLFWSHGNESGPGENFKAADDAVHARDASRPTHYEGDWKASDVDSNMYPDVNGVWWHANQKDAKRPYYICEYAHNMINAMGNLKDYQDAIESSDVVIGGTIWDWVDQGLYKLNKDGVKIIGYGGDWGDKPNDGQFVMNGCILSDRALEPAYWEIKHVFQPVSVTLDEGAETFTVFNKQYFRGLDVYDATWQLVLNGEVVQTEKLDLDAVGPRGRKTLPVPAAARAAVKAGTSVSVRVRFACRAQDGYLEKGYVIADDQLDLPNAYRAVPFTAPAGKAAWAKRDGRLVFTAGRVELAFDLATGALASYKVDGAERFLKPMTLDAYRAPSSNEVGPAGVWTANGWRAFKSTVASVSEVVEEDGACAFTLVVDYVGAEREELRNFGSNGAWIRKSGQKPGAFAPTFTAAQRWRVYADGTATCQSEIRGHAAFGLEAELPRIGYHFVLPLDFAQVKWFGRGPFENYRDRKSGAFRGRWEMDLTHFVMPYARPEDVNNWEETDALTLSGAKGALGFATLGAPFACAAQPWSAQEIVEAMHPAELPAPAKVEVGIFAETRGLGGASCGPGPLKQDIITTKKPYRLDFAILPRGATTALHVPPAELPSTAKATPSVGFRGSRLCGVSSEEGGQERAAHAFDGKLETMWHSRWSRDCARHPHWIACDLGKTVKLAGAVAVPRQDGNSHGRIRKYRLETSVDNTSWTVAKEGVFPDDAQPHEVLFAKPVEAKFLRLTALSAHHNQDWASLAELIPLVQE